MKYTNEEIKEIINKCAEETFESIFKKFGGLYIPIIAIPSLCSLAVDLSFKYNMVSNQGSRKFIHKIIDNYFDKREGEK